MQIDKATLFRGASAGRNDETEHQSSPAGAATCVTLTSPDVDTAIARTDTDIDASNPVTSTHISGGQIVQTITADGGTTCVTP